MHLHTDTYRHRLRVTHAVRGSDREHGETKGGCEGKVPAEYEVDGRLRLLPEGIGALDADEKLGKVITAEHLPSQHFAKQKDIDLHCPNLEEAWTHF